MPLGHREADILRRLDDLAFVGFADPHVVDVADDAACGGDLGERHFHRVHPFRRRLAARRLRRLQRLDMGLHLDGWAELVKLGHDYLVDLEDAAIIWREENGEVHVTTPAHHAVAKGTVSGLFWGTLIGLLFMFPLAPLAGVAGGIMGAALGAAWRLGIEDDFRQRVQDLVQPGTSALMVIVRKTTPEKFTEALRPYGGPVLKTSLPRDAELELMKALHGDNPDSPTWTQSSVGVQCCP